MTRIAIVVGQPKHKSFCEALAEAYRRGAEASGHEVRLFVLANMSFDPILHEGFDRPQKLEPDLAEAQAAIIWAEHLVLIFPLWFGSMPALLNGFFERVYEPGVMAEKRAVGGGFRPLMKGRSARIIITMNMPSLVYRYYFGAHALKLIKRNILGFVGFGPIRSRLYGMVEGVNDARRRGWLAEVEAMGHGAG
jgi:putative NADPH-quinone reductase